MSVERRRTLSRVTTFSIDIAPNVGVGIVGTWNAVFRETGGDCGGVASTFNI
jgi:hypothetical protein